MEHQKPDPQMCVYCGQRAAVKREHVVARVFFPKPRPDPMITVPACDQCDAGEGGLHHDEEYMRNMLCLRLDITTNNAVARKLRDENVPKSFAHSPALANVVGRTVRQLFGIDANGKPYPTSLYQYDAERLRFNRVLQKIARGLHYFEWQSPLAYDAVFEIVPFYEQEDFDKINSSFAAEWKSVGSDVFHYKQDRNVAPFLGHWILLFYGHHGVYVVAMKPDDPNIERFRQHEMELRRKYPPPIFGIDQEKYPEWVFVFERFLEDDEEEALDQYNLSLSTM